MGEVYRRRTRGSIARSPSRSCRSTRGDRRSARSASSARRRRSRRARTPTSARSTTSASAGRDRLPGAWSARGRDAGASAWRGAAAARAGAAIADRRSPTRSTRAPAGHRPPRPEARQHHADEGAARSCSTSASPSAMAPAARRRRSPEPRRGAAAHLTSRRDRRHAPLHGAGAARGQGRRTRARDIFAFGALLYEMATGEGVRGRDAALISAIMSGEPAPI